MSILESNASITHTFGNVACVVMDYIKQYFSEDFFKVTHISTKLAYRQLDIYRSKQKEIWKLHKPILILRPRIEMDDSSKYFYGSAWMNRFTNIRSPMEFTNTVDLLLDKQNGTNLKFIWNRYKIYYDIVMIFDTLNEQLNIANHLNVHIVPNTPFLLNTALESYIPKNLILSIADYLGIESDNTAGILGYLNTYGVTPFTYKFKDGSGTDEFFSLYNTNIEMIASELSIDDGETKGMTGGNYTISFTLSAEFSAMACFLLFLRNNDNRVSICPPVENKDNRVVTLYTIPLLYDLKLEPGWKMITAPSFIVEDRNDVDVTNLSQAIPSNIGLPDILINQKKMNMKEDSIIRFRVFKDREELIKGVDFEVDTSDVDSIKLFTYDCDIKKTYRVFVILNMGLINSINAEAYKFNDEK